METKKAFTLVEILIALLIIAASWTLAATINPKGQTAKREADKLQAQLEKSFAQAERVRKVCYLLFKNDNKTLFVYFGDDSENSKDITATEGCSYLTTGELITGGRVVDYNPNAVTPSNNDSNIGIKGADGSYRYIIISSAGRLRQDENPTSGWTWGLEW